MEKYTVSLTKLFKSCNFTPADIEAIIGTPIMSTDGVVIGTIVGHNVPRNEIYCELMSDDPRTNKFVENYK